MPTVIPEDIERSISERAFFFALAEYLKLTLSKAIEPSFTSVTGFSGFLMAGISRSTSSIRLNDSADIVSITYIIESIISCIRIWKP